MASLIDFYFSFYKDEIYVARLTHQLAKHFPESRVIGISDGPYYKPSLESIKELNPNLIILDGDRLKHKAHGGCEFTQRNFEMVLATSKAETIVKLDPDSYISRSCTIPKNEWFGHVHSAAIPFMGSQFQFIAGGAMGFSRETIIKIVESKLLLNEKYDNEAGFYDRYKAYRKYADPINAKDLLRREDWVLGDVCRRLKIKATHWSEVYCVQDREQEIRDVIAICHPVRHLW